MYMVEMISAQFDSESLCRLTLIIIILIHFSIFESVLHTIVCLNYLEISTFYCHQGEHCNFKSVSSSFLLKVKLFWFTHSPIHSSCFEQKMLNKEFGGTVLKKDIREDGQFKITVETSSPIFRFAYNEREKIVLY